MMQQPTQINGNLKTTDDRIGYVVLDGKEILNMCNVSHMNVKNVATVYTV